MYLFCYMFLLLYSLKKAPKFTNVIPNLKIQNQMKRKKILHTVANRFFCSAGYDLSSLRDIFTTVCGR